MDATIRLTVNGEKKTLVTPPDRSLLDVLREDLHLTGTKYGCGQARCGACTVLVDGRAVRACSMRLGSAQGRSIITIEGLASGDVLHPMQEAFLAEGAIQCGYCTPGMVLRAVALLDRYPNPTDAQIKAGMNGNICRCNGYTKIVQAIQRGAAQMREVKL